MNNRFFGIKNNVKIIIVAGILSQPGMVSCETASVNALLAIQQNINTQCLARSQGRARILCRCAAVVATKKIAIEGLDAFNKDAQAWSDQAYEHCSNNEDHGYVMETARLYQSQTSIEQLLQQQK